MENVVAIIVAGGFGKRMTTNIAKQYLLLGGIPILSHTLLKFEEASSVNDVILVVPPGDREYVTRSIVEKFNLSKVRHVGEGGAKRQDSVRNGLAMVDNGDGIVLIHDGARPFITPDLIDLSVERAKTSGAMVVGMPARDTVKSVDEGNWIKKTLPRDTLWLAQTPQVFRAGIIKKAYEKAYDEGFYGTDDAEVVERMGITVEMMRGSSTNIKITTPEDLVLGEFLMEKL
ncbi:MAG: 2-C-methyl-D-erythritol 4-phosphate cytidylyltransferase [Deltaproteobacteria bacterium]|nr:2-C-methyl-D-erythritol 4-phosphate cytidylyltransferase [Deltaproteobacteria bacterium]